jgi:hypothetical protein
MKLALVLLVAASVVGCGGYSKPANTPPQPGIMPVISNLVPNNVNANSGSFPLEVDGTNFASGAKINFNGTAQATTRVSASKLTATIPNSAIAPSGTVPVTVTNPAVSGGLYGGGTAAATSAPMNFTIN